MTDIEATPTTELDFSAMMTETGLILPPNLPFEEFRRIGYFIQHEAAVSMWRLGDWVNYGEEVYQEHFYDAVEQNMFDPTRFRRSMVTARTFYPHDQRRTTLSWEHHDEAAGKLYGHPLSTMTKWLDAAEENGWTPGQLGQEIRKSLALEVGEVEEDEPELEEPTKATTEALLRFSVRVPISCAAEAEELRSILEADLRSTLTSNGVVVKGVEYGVSYS